MASNLLFMDTIEVIAHLFVGGLANADKDAVANGKGEVVHQRGRQVACVLPAVGLRVVAADVGKHLSVGANAAVMKSADDISILRGGSRCRKGACLPRYGGALHPFAFGQELCPPVKALALVTCACEIPPAIRAAAAAKGTRRVAVRGDMHIDSIPVVGRDVVAEHIACIGPAEAVAHVEFTVTRESDGVVGVVVGVVGKACPLPVGEVEPPPVAQVGAVGTISAIETESEVDVFVGIHARCGIDASRQGRDGGILRPLVGGGVVLPQVVHIGACAVPTAEDVALTRIRKGSRRGAWRRHVRTARDGHLDVGDAVAGGEGKEHQEEYVGLRFNTLLIKGVCRGAIGGLSRGVGQSTRVFFLSSKSRPR